MKITYIHHSSFFVETNDCYLLFDYFKDDSYIEKSIREAKKPVYILSSHHHKDHFNRNIFDFEKNKADVKFILSKDILNEALAFENEADFLEKGDIYNDSLIYVKAFGSTDEGISFYLEIDGLSLFHSGDLNNWHWSEEVDEAEAKGYEDAYLLELADISSKIKEIDVLMFPIDKRLGTDYFKGAVQFIENVKINLFIPMHFWGDFKSAILFKGEALKRGCSFFEIMGEYNTIEI